MKLYPHQVAALRKLHELNGRALLAIAMGGGKTRTALADMKLHNVQRLLVVLPLSVASVWERECSIIDYPLPVRDGTSGPIKQRAQMVNEMAKTRLSAVLIVNYESFWREPLRSAIEKWQPEGIIFDEGHRIRHRGSRQSRFAHALGSRGYVHRKLLLTGTPITNGIQDAWSLFRFINPSVFGTRWADFERAHLIMGGFQFRQITGVRDEQVVKDKIAVNSFQWDGGLPSPPDVAITVRLSAQTRRVYEELRKKAITEVQNSRGESKVVLARLAITLLLRLQQVSSGFTKSVGEEEIEVGTEKADAVADLLSDIVAQKKRAVVFVRFVRNITMLQDRLSEYRVAVLRGGQKQSERKQIQEDFDLGKYDVVICQIRVGGLGIDLASASAAIFYSVGHSLDDFLQAKGRLAGALRQRHPVVYYHLLAEKTVDQAVYSALTSKTRIAGRVTDLSYALNLLGGTTV